MPCFVFENDEAVRGRKMGSSAAYCEPCFREVMEESEEADVMIVAKLAKIKFLISKKNELLQKKIYER